MRRLIAAACLALLAACGGGGGGGGTEPPTAGPDGSLDDPTVYSSAPTASLAGAVEAEAVSRHRLRLDGTDIDYTATAGHVIARDPLTRAAQASVFYVAYTRDGADAATRPVTFFYNGGPGSASVWLHLGSFGPKRLVTGIPATTAARPFPLVDNADSLLHVSDLVYVNAVGSGRSQAIAPFRNQDFWGVDADAALFRDAIRRWRVRHGRQASPFFLYGESYGGPRTAVLARRLQEQGVMPAGLVLQSPAMDYNANCGVGVPGISCAGYLPSFAAVGAWHGLSTPATDDDLAWADAAVAYVEDGFAAALDAWLAAPAPRADLWPELAALTGLPAAQWQASLNLGPERFRSGLIPGQLIGRYDGRMQAAVGSALAAEGDPSSTWLGSSFQSAINSYLRDTLGYRNGSTYVMFSGAIDLWDFSHAGRALPDTVPDLAAALQADPALQVLAVSGVHDLATPFHVTATDLARLGSPRVVARHYAGGHMSFLDDTTRPRQRADVAAFITARAAVAATRRAPLAAALEGPAPRDRAGVPAAAAGVALPEPAFQAPMRDPWVPERLRRPPG